MSRSTQRPPADIVEEAASSGTCSITSISSTSAAGCAAARRRATQRATRSAPSAGRETCRSVRRVKRCRPRRNGRRIAPRQLLARRRCRRSRCRARRRRDRRPRAARSDGPPAPVAPAPTDADEPASKPRALASTRSIAISSVGRLQRGFGTADAVRPGRSSVYSNSRESSAANALAESAPPPAVQVVTIATLPGPGSAGYDAGS